MADPKYTLNRTGSEVAEAITKALNSAKKASEATTVVTNVKFKDNKAVYSAEVTEDEVLVLTAVTLETTTDDIYEAEDNTTD